jgi:hypothetical protein
MLREDGKAIVDLYRLSLSELRELGIPKTAGPINT